MSSSWLAPTRLGLLAACILACFATGLIGLAPALLAQEEGAPEETIPDERSPEADTPSIDDAEASGDTAGEEGQIHEVIIDDSGIIIRQDEGDVELEIGKLPKKGIDVRVRGVGDTEIDSEGEVYFSEDVIVRATKVIQEDMLVLFGDLTIYGKVVGDILVVSGDVRLYDGAEVTGDITCIGGKVDSEDGAQVFGEINPVAMSLPSLLGSGWDFDDLGIRGRRGSRGYSTGGAIFHLIEILLLAWAGMLILRTRIPNLSFGLRRRPGQSLLIGFLSFLATLLLLIPLALLFLVLALTIIGIPVVVFAVAVIAGLGILGWLVPLYAFSTYSFESRGMNRFLSVGIWAVIFWIIHSLGKISGLPWLFGIIEVLVFLAGIGALVLTRLGARRLSSA